MLAKRSSWALALLLALPSAAFSLGLGDIHLLSALNAPLQAEIELVDVAPDELNSVQAQVASRDTFAHYGLEWPAYLSGVQVHAVHTPDGRNAIKLTSTDSISDPFLTLLVEVSWAHGHLVREYTVLLDPPVYAPNQSAVASAPVAAPSTGTGAHEGSIARPPDAPVSAPAPSSSAETAMPSAAPSGSGTESSASETPPAPAPSRAAAARSSETADSGSAAGEGSSHVVQHGETLSRIAAGVAAAQSDSARAQSWMVAIYQANPRAFDQNMNVLRTGAVLRIPDATQVSAISASSASAEIHRQYAAWRPAAGDTAAAASGTEQPGRLKLVTPSESASAGATPGASTAQVGELQGRIKDLQGQLAESKRLLELKNADLARLQAQLAAKNGGAPAVTTAPTPPPPAPTVTAPPETAPPAVVQTAPPPATQEPPPPVVAPPVVETAPPVTRPTHSGGSFFATLKSLWWLLALVLLAVLAVVGLKFMRAKRATEFDDSLGRLAVAGADAASSPARGFSDPPMRAGGGAVPDTSFLVEETGSHERPRLGAAAAAAATKHVASDETISSETAINLDQGDPLAEADFHMAYGLYDQAADLIRIAISREPTRRDLKLKLLEVFFVWGNKEQFLTAARELAETRAGAAPGEWEKILIMGKQLAPEDSLFSGGGAVAGATAGGVDLDLEGGQSRVDFDLLGEPVPGEVAQGVDLDIGAAVGDHIPEATTNVTDRNQALLEGNFTGQTGTTRQMTQRVRQDSSGVTGEVEGPTVEQPGLAQPDQPTIRQKLETALKQNSNEQTAELAIDDLGLDLGQADTIDQLGITAAGNSTPDGPTLVAGLDETSRKSMEDAQRRAVKEQTGVSSGAWQFDQDELEAALTQTSAALPETSSTSRLRALGAHDLDVDFGDATGTHPAAGDGVDLDVGSATGTHAAANGLGLDLDVGTATVPDTAFAATQRLSSEDLALPDLEPVTMSEVGTKLDLARAYMDMGDPDGARNILEEVLHEGSAAQKQEAQRLMESLPG